MTRGRRRTLFTFGGAALFFVLTFVVYVVLDSTIGISTGPRWLEAVTVAFFTAIGGLLFGLMASGLKEDGEDDAADRRSRRRRRGNASRTG